MRLNHLIAGVLLLGIADSMIGPYLVLFGADEANLSPFQVGVFVSLIAASGLVVSTWLGRRYDRSEGRWPAVVAVTAPAVGYLVLTVTTDYVLLLLVAIGFLGAGMAAFPQLFSLARTHLATGPAAARGNPVLRSVWSLAWAIGPLLGAVVLAWQGYRGLLLVTAAVFVLVLVPLAALGHTAPGPAREPTGTPGTERHRWTRPVLLAVASYTLFHTAMLSGSVALPLYVTRTLDLSDSDVGLLFSVCAFVEVPAALGLLLLPARMRKRPLILAGMLLFVAYFVMVAASSTLAALVATQVARGVAIAVVGALGITYVQDLLPTAPGRATALFANTLTTGSLISGVLAGAVAQTLGYQAALLLCGGLAALGAALLAVSGPEDRATAVPAPEAGAATVLATD
ncbi:sugar efflux transporter [Virgisporangium ochraceum]|uniref:Putative sugar efflux transporter n=2 Tax=Virgisporangium ochraceum TaxID=65505 RepID=A0A8J3ZTZ2_9ACTN|nr:sugar efflux transporter [Virgisporangium ochraceum]GIJ68018.1 putative sugar efflux transporter [Virgisporangium ochraceum]